MDFDHTMDGTESERVVSNNSTNIPTVAEMLRLGVDAAAMDKRNSHGSFKAMCLRSEWIAIANTHYRVLPADDPEHMTVDGYKTFYTGLGIDKAEASRLSALYPYVRDGRLLAHYEELSKADDIKTRLSGQGHRFRWPGTPSALKTMRGLYEPDRVPIAKAKTAPVLYDNEEQRKESEERLTKLKADYDASQEYLNQTEARLAEVKADNEMLRAKVADNEALRAKIWDLEDKLKLATWPDEILFAESVERRWSDYGYDEKFPQWRLATGAAFDMVLVKYQYEPDGEWDDIGWIDISHEGYRLMMWDKEVATCDGGTENIFNAIVALVPERVDAATAPTATPDATNKKKAASKASKAPRKRASKAAQAAKAPTLKDGTSEPVRTKERVRQTGEIMTPPALVEEILGKLYDNDPQLFKDSDKTFLDPSFGTGNILSEILSYKIRYNQSPEVPILRILRSMYGIELMADNVEYTRKRVFEEAEPYLSTDADKQEAREILNHNLVCHDAFTWDYDNWCPMPEGESFHSTQQEGSQNGR